MKRYVALLITALLASTAGLRAQGLDDQYFAIFSLIQEGDTLSATDPAKAVGKYVQAQTILQRFQKGNPDYNPQVVSFRLNYLAGRLAELSSATAQGAPVTPGLTNRITGEVTPPPRGESTNAPGDLQWQVDALKEQVKQMIADRALLQAKLKEALAAQPAESDPRELARAEERIKALQKENELLRVSLETQKSKAPTLDPKAGEQVQTALAEANRQLAQQKELNAKLTVEKDALQAKAKANPDLAALQAENEILKKQILSSSASTAQQQAAAPNADGTRVRQLERERDDLIKKLEAANKAAGSKKTKVTAKQLQDLELQLSGARARLEVLEARQVPLTAEELAWLKQPAATPAPSQPSTSSSGLGPSATKLLAEAQSYFASRQLDKAEAAYAELLKQDPRNVLCLANMAAIQSESGKLTEAEANAKAALAEKPDDAFSLYILGITKFRQTKYDDSLDALSRAAKIQPNDPQIQNYLGLALTEKGMRAPAEAALRKAIQLQPNYALAHYNLAVAYSSQQPPAIELARFHYQKAIALGQPANPEMEKRFQSK